MTTRSELASALRQADAAGDVDGARRLADAIRKMDATPNTSRGTVGPDGIPDLLRRPASQMPSNEPQYDLQGQPYIPRFHQPQPAAPVATQPNKPWNDKAADWLRENLVPAAEKAGTSLGGMVGGARPVASAAGQVGGDIMGGLANWTGTVLKNPEKGATEAVDLLEPTHHIAKGWNSLSYALNEAMQGNFEQARQDYMEATPELLGGAAGILPGGSITSSLLTKTARGPSISSQIFKPGPSGLDRAADLLIKKMKADGLTIEDLQTAAGSLARRGDSGVYETLSEVAALSGKSSGANLRGLAMALGSVPGPAQEALIRRVMENAEKLPQRTSRAASRATGQDASKTVATLDELEMRLKTESGPKYDAAYDTPIDPQIYEGRIAPVLATERGMQAKAAALSGLKGIEADLAGKVASGDRAALAELQRVKQSVASLQQGIPTTQALDHVKRAFDDLIEEKGQASYSAGNIRGTKSNLAESISAATGGRYGEAIGFYEGGKRLEEAFDIGLNALKQPTWQLERAMKAGIKGRQFSGGEIEAIALGVARYIDDLVEANDQRALTTLSKSKALKNIETALGDPKAAKAFDQSIKRLMANREWGRRVAGGSDTQMRREAVRDATAGEEDAVTRAIERVETSSAPPTLLGLAWSGLAKPAAKAGKDAYRRFRYPGIYDEEVNAALAPLMSSPMTKGEMGKLMMAVESRLGKKGSSPALKVAPKAKALASPVKKQGLGEGFVSENLAAAGVGSVGGSVMDREDPERGALIGMMAGLGGRAALRSLPKGRAIAGEQAGIGRPPKGPPTGGNVAGPPPRQSEKSGPQKGLPKGGPSSYGGIPVRTPDFDGERVIREMFGEPSKYMPWRGNPRFKELADKAGETVGEVPVSELRTTQSQLRHNFKEIPERYGNTDADLPQVVRENGVYYIRDGNHRIAAQVSGGATSVRARIIDLDAPPQTTGRGGASNLDKEGFDTKTTYYHGTNSAGDIRPGRDGLIFVSKDPNYAGFYAKANKEGANVRPLMIRGKLMSAKDFQKLNEKFDTESAAYREAKRLGYDGVEFVDETVLFDAKNIRGKFESSAPPPPPVVAGPPKPPAQKAKPNPVVQETLRDVDREAVARLLEKRKNADAASIPDIDAQVAAILKRNKKPHKPPPPVLSKEVQDFDARIKEAEKRFTADRRKFGRFPDQREAVYQVHMDEIADLKRQRAEALARDQAGKGLQKFGRQTYNAMPKVAATIGLGLGAGVVGGSVVGAYNATRKPPAEADGQKQGRISPPEDTRSSATLRNSRNRQLVQQVQVQLNALGWRLAPDGIMLGKDGLHGAQTDTQKAVRRFQYENDLPVTGLLDADTLDAIDAAYREQLNQRASGRPTEAYQSGR